MTDQTERRSPSFLARKRSQSVGRANREYSSSEAETDDAETGTFRGSETIEEDYEPELPKDVDDGQLDEGPSLLARALRRSPPDTQTPEIPQHDGRTDEPATTAQERSPQVLPSIRPRIEEHRQPTETSPLLGPRSDAAESPNGTRSSYDLESQKRPIRRRLFGYFSKTGVQAWHKVSHVFHVAVDPKRWDRRALWQNVVVAPIACLPAVIVGLLLNILDALSYGKLLQQQLSSNRKYSLANDALGMILFPLGSPIFANLGSAGISIFYVSTIVSQLIFSSGSIFKGGIGSELVSCSCQARSPGIQSHIC